MYKKTCKKNGGGGRCSFSAICEKPGVAKIALHPSPTRMLINFRSWSQLMWLGDLMLDSLALLFQTVSGLRVDLVTKFGGGTWHCFCFHLFLKIQQGADKNPPPSNSLRWSTALFPPCIGRVAWRLVASTPAAQSQLGGRERWTMICRHDSCISRNCPPDRRHGSRQGWAIASNDQFADVDMQGSAALRFSFRYLAHRS